MKKRWLTVLNLCAAVMMLGACGAKEDSGTDKTEIRVIASYEAEAGTFAGNVATAADLTGYTGDGYVIGFNEDADTCTIAVEAPEDGFYNLNFISASLGGYKENKVYVDGESLGNIVNEAEAFEPVTVERVYMTAGAHEVTVEKYWGYIALDSLELTTCPELDASIYEVTAKLTNENADDSAKRLMSFLVDNYGKNILAGQYCDTGLYGQETACIWKVTGKFPAVVGLDMSSYSPVSVENGAVGRSVEYAQQAWEAGAIVTMCWHWTTPAKYVTGQWYSTFYKESTSIDLDKIMNGEDTEGHDLIEADMDAIAKELQVLQEAGVPVLWRPLHEASGGWFWWGDCEAQSYIDLYRWMYDKFTNEYGLNNLIWIWNGQNIDWYPGDDVVDIIGEDVYAGEQVYTSQVNKFLEAVNYTEAKKMVVMSENGCIFDPDLALRDGAMWGFYAVWGGEFVTESGGLNIYSERYTDEEMLNKVYQHENVITLDELPDLTTYEIRSDAE